MLENYNISPKVIENSGSNKFSYIYNTRGNKKILYKSGVLFASPFHEHISRQLGETVCIYSMSPLAAILLEAFSYPIEMRSGVYRYVVFQLNLYIDIHSRKEKENWAKNGIHN